MTAHSQTIALHRSAFSNRVGAAWPRVAPTCWDAGHIHPCGFAGQEGPAHTERKACRLGPARMPKNAN